MIRMCEKKIVVCVAYQSQCELNRTTTKAIATKNVIENSRIVRSKETAKVKKKEMEAKKINVFFFFKLNSFDSYG